jgi:hypothetical protein
VRTMARPAPAVGNGSVVNLAPEAASGPGADCRLGWPPSFDQLLEAEKHARRRSADPADLNRYCDIRSRYEATHGTIVDLFVCNHLDGAGAAQTDANEIKVRYPADLVAALQPEFEETLWRATALSREGNQLLSGRRATILASMLQSVIVCLLGVLDSQHQLLSDGEGKPPGPPPKRIERSLTTAGKELDRIARYLHRSAQCVAQKYYLQGMALSLPFLPLIALLLGRMRIMSVPVEPLVIAGVGGGVGALISVMTRITSGKLTLDAHADPIVLRLSGAFRPLIGAILGLAVYVLMQSGLVPATPPAAPKDLYFFAAVGRLQRAVGPGHAVEDDGRDDRRHSRSGRRQQVRGALGPAVAAVGGPQAALRRASGGPQSSKTRPPDGLAEPLRRAASLS